MIPGAGKTKGAQFEREICVKLSLWLTHGQHKDILWRSAMSGGRATLGRRKGEMPKACGDICAVAPEGHAFSAAFYIECKHLKHIGFDGLIKQEHSALSALINKTWDEAAKYNRKPLLILQQNRWPTILFSNAAGFELLEWTPRLRYMGPNAHAGIRLFDELMAFDPPLRFAYAKVLRQRGNSQRVLPT